MIKVPDCKTCGMDLERALELTVDGDSWTAQVPDGWAQGRTTFGGLVGGYLARAVQASHDRPLRSLDVYFLEPVLPGEVRLVVDSAREGKYLTQASVTMSQQGRAVARAQVVLADVAAGKFDEVPANPEPEKVLDDCVQMPFIDGITPEFTAQMDVRYGEGEFPYTGSARAVAGGFVRNRSAARGVAALLTHIDCWPPPVLALADSPMAASTVRWHVQFHDDVNDADGEQWSWFRGEANWRSGRLATVTGLLVREGRPVAYAEQTQAMYF